MRAEEISVAIFPFEGPALTDKHINEPSVVAAEIITHLSRYRQFKIVPPAVDLSRHADTTYSVKTVFHVAGEKLRFNVQLINNNISKLAWADAFELASYDDDTRSHELTRIASALHQNLTFDLLHSVRQKPASALTPYEHWLLGMEELKLGSAIADENARAHFQLAMDADSSYSLAYSGMSLTYFNEWSCQLWERWDVSHQGAYEWAKRAIELDPRNYVASMVLGRVYLYEAKYELAEHYLQKALQLNMTDPDNLIQVATCLVYLERLDEALDLFKRALSLSPDSQEQYYYMGALIAFERGDFHECIRLSTKGNLLWVDSFEILAAAYFEVDDKEKMNESWKRFLLEFRKKILKDEREPEPGEAIQWVINVSPYKGPTRQRRFWEHFGGKRVASSERTFKVASPPQPRNFFFREKDMWLIGYEGQSFRIGSFKGLNDLAVLLAAANNSVHCSQLIGGGVKARAFEVIDQKALRAFRNRLSELEEEIAWNEQQNNSIGLSTSQEEYDQLVNTIKSVTGLGGKLRKGDDPMEKIRSAVTLRIRSAIKKVSAQHPTLARHLDNSIKTGIFCSYSPEKPISWSIEY